MPFSLCGSEIWPFTQREELRFRILEHKAVRRMFGPKRWEITGCRSCISVLKGLEITTRMDQGTEKDL
jgi:hypothetical protein